MFFARLVKSNTAWFATAIVILNVVLTAIPQLTEQLPTIKLYGDLAIVVVAAVVKVLQELTGS